MARLVDLILYKRAPLRVRMHYERPGDSFVVLYLLLIRYKLPQP